MSNSIKDETSESLSSSSSSSSLPTSMYNISKLDGNNWSSWYMRITAILVEKELDSVVDGTVKMTDANKDSWTRKNNQAKSLIILSIAEDQLMHIKGIGSAQVMMAKLQKVNQIKGLASRLYLKK